MDWFARILALGVCGLAGLTLAGMFGRYHHWLDICDHFRFQYLLLLSGLAVGGFIGQSWLWGGLAAAFALLNLAVISPIFRLPPGWKHGSSTYRLLMANVLRQNQSFPLLVDLARASQPDVIGLVEADQAWLEGLQALKERYPYCLTALRQDNYGLILYSRHPIRHSEVLTLTAKGVPTLLVMLELDGSPLVVYLSHPPPPKNTPDVHLRDEQLLRLGELAAERPEPVLVCGDFNITPWASAFRRLARSGGLTDSTSGFGFQPTWPVANRWLRVPIDHCLVSKDIRVARRTIGAPVGSDHLPLVVDFTIQQD
jgi:endonuclease/exonuclease/phosphatase (EEP) superfamily protein YafD